MAESYRQKFERRYPNATSEDPLETALIRGEDVQEVANHLAILFLNRPKWWYMTIEAEYGELPQYQIGNVIEITKDFPGLENGRRLLVLGRSGGAKSTKLELELWG